MESTFISNISSEERSLEFMEIDLSSIETALNPERGLDISAGWLAVDKPY